MKTGDHSWKGHVALLAANIIWGLNAPIGKEALAVVSASAVTAYRMLGACLAFWLLSLFLPHEHVTRRDKVLLIFAALFGIVFNQGMFIYGLSLTSPVDGIDYYIDASYNHDDTFCHFPAGAYNMEKSYRYSIRRIGGPYSHIRQ